MADDGSTAASAASPAAPAQRDLFVSYATGDAGDIAENVVIDLERRGLRCWVAPRDIPAGSKSWAAEIVRAIRDCDNFVLLLSEAANASDEIEKELSEAARHRKTVFVIRVADIEPSDGLGYHLNRVQWRDLFRNRETVLNEIAGRVLALREVQLAARAGRPVGPVVAAQDFHAHTQPMASPAQTALPKPAAKPIGMLLGALGVLAAAGMAGWLALRPAPPPPVSPEEARQRAAIEKAALERAQEELASRERQKARDDLIGLLSPHLPYHPGNLVDRYMEAQPSRALVVAPGTGGNFSANLANEADALTVALEACQIIHHYAGSPCAPVSVNGKALVEPGQPLKPQAGPRVAYEGAFDPAMIAAVNPQRRNQPELLSYKDAPGPKAAALYPFGRVFTAVNAGDQYAAEQKALSDCNAYARVQRVVVDCFLYAVGDQVVLPKRALQPITLQVAGTVPEQAPAASPMNVASMPPPVAPPVVAARPSAPTTSAPAVSTPAPTAVAPATPPRDVRSDLIKAMLRVAPQYPNAERQADRYLSGRNERALAGSPPAASWRNIGAPTQADAVSAAIEGCALYVRTECTLVAVNEDLRTLADFPGAREQAARRVGYEGPFDPAMIPAIWSSVRQLAHVQGYGAAAGPKAVALSPIGVLRLRTRAPSQNDAETGALAECNEQVRRVTPEPIPCYLYAIGDRIVLRQRLQAAVTAR